MDAVMLMQLLGEIDDNYIYAAGKRLGLIGAPQPGAARHAAGRHSARRPVHKWLAAFAAAVLLLLTCSLAAMAASEDFRQAVFAFFGIAQTEVVPPREVSSESIYAAPDRIELGGVIEGTYVHTPAASYAQNGIYLICTDPVETRQGSRYDAYWEENGAFEKLTAHTFSQDITVQGRTYPVTFEWAAHGRSIVQTYVPADASFRMPNQFGAADQVFFLLEDGYPVLLDLETGACQDILAGTGAEMLTDIGNAAISEDRQRLLLVQTDGTLYYVDLAAKTLYSVEALSGERADACCLAGDTLACWALREDGYHAWAIDLATLSRREIFSGLPNAAGTAGPGIVFLMGFDTWVHGNDLYAGSCFALETDAARNVYVWDLASGVRMPVEGFQWPQTQACPDVWQIASPDGKKLLLAGGHTGENFTYIGVVDFARRRYVTFSRQNDTPVRESSVIWFDEDRVLIRTSPEDAICDYYVYRLLDTPQ